MFSNTLSGVLSQISHVLEDETKCLKPGVGGDKRTYDPLVFQILKFSDMDMMNMFEKRDDK